MREIRSTPLRYGLALGSFALIMLSSFALQRLIPFRIDLTSLIILAMIASAWYLGFGPGLLLAIVLEVTLDYFSHPTFSFKSGFIIFNRMVLFTSVVWFASSRQQAERRLAELLKREQLARAEAEQADRLKDEFLATVSHELRTPLTSIVGWASLLRKGSVNQETAERGLEVIERNAKAQAEIVGDILDVSGIITGKLRIDPQAVELGPIVFAAVDTLRLAAAAKRITVSISPAQGGEFVAGDPDRLQQVFWNLISNAIKFTPEDGSVGVSINRVDSEVCVRISDSGIGIESEFLPHVFERFRQADSSTTRRYGGLGLGLSIVRHLVELHGGKVSAESAGEGKGATFEVHLPEASRLGLSAAPRRGVETEATGPSRDAGVSGDGDLSHARVLLVDDEADTLDVLTIMLNEHGAEVWAASSSAEAIVALNDWKPNVLVSDLSMPDEDGFALISKIRGLPPGQRGDIPAAALTAHARQEDRARALAAGYQAHIPKPVDQAVLCATISALIKRTNHT